MLFGIDIDYWYIGVISASLFCMALAGISWIINKVKEWKKRSQDHP